MHEQPLSSRIGPAFRFAWDTFAARWGRLVGIYAIYLGVMFALIAPVWVAWVITFQRWALADAGSSWGTPVPDQPPVWMFVSFGVVWVLAMVGTLFMQVWNARLGLDATAGRELSLRRFFSLKGIGRALGATLIVGLATGIGTLLCVIPGLVAAVAMMFVVPLVLDRGLRLADAIRESARMVRRDLGGCLLFALAIAGVTMVGQSTGFGTLVAAPLAALLSGCLYREVSARG